MTAKIIFIATILPPMILIAYLCLVAEKFMSKLFIEFLKSKK